VEADEIARDHEAALNRRYERHAPPDWVERFVSTGTTTLFAALDVANGEVIARPDKRRRRVEFLDFMNQIVAAYPEREIHVVLDNLSTQNPKRDVWLNRHKTGHFHYTPAHASWLSHYARGRRAISITNPPPFLSNWNVT
jgi:hypothetical protein